MTGSGVVFLPLGISFFTFEFIRYAEDSYALRNERIVLCRDGALRAKKAGLAFSFPHGSELRLRLASHSTCPAPPGWTVETRFRETSKPGSDWTLMCARVGRDFRSHRVMRRAAD
jgi:hypothetical protein